MEIPGEDEYEVVYGGEYCGEGMLEWEPEEPEAVLAFVQTIIQELIERTIPEPKRPLTLEKAAKCLSILGKIWNLSECHEGCEIDSIKCQTSDQRLLDMEGYVEEYQYLHLGATDMALSDVWVIPNHFIWLLSVDVSGNRLDNISACPLTKLANLVSLKLNRNRIDDPYLEPMKHLQYLGMNSNKIKSMHRIYHPNLMTLDLNWNLIQRIDAKDCWKLKKLRQLELRGNRLLSTKGIRYENLVSLYLPENHIVELVDLEYLPKLRRLHLRSNPLSDLFGFTEANAELEYLNVRSCQIEDVREFKKLKVLKNLSVLVMKNNLFNPIPAAEEDEDEVEDDDDEIRIQVLTHLPQLMRINKRVVTKEERELALEAEEEDQEPEDV